MSRVVTRLLVRVLVVLTAVLGVDYVAWRWVAVNWSAWWIALPLVLAETVSLVGAVLHGVTLWRVGEPAEPTPPDPAATADVFVTTADEPVELVLATARAARRIRFPHRTWILDGGARPEMQVAAEVAGIGYLPRPDLGTNLGGPVTADDLDTALFVTEGEFLLVLGVDEIPEPTLLDRVLGHFSDPDVAVVQIPPSGPDVLDAAPLFPGPLPRAGTDRNAFFCGATVVLRRAALMQLGIAGHRRRTERTVRRVLRTAETMLRKARDEARQHGPGVLAALDQVEAAVEDARREVRTVGRRTSIAEITYRFRQRVDTASRGLVDADVVALHADLADREPSGGWQAAPVVPYLDNALLAWLSRQAMSPLRAMASVRALVDAVDVSHADEPPPLSATAPAVTEDMTTTLRLLATGWTSVVHPERLTHGPTTPDLGPTLRQRLRWAQGALPVLLRESSRGRGLPVGQRLARLAALWSYVSGFCALVYLVAPVVLLGFDVAPVDDYGPDLLVRLVPYLVLNQLLLAVGYGRRAWRGTPYGMALFPLWIRATTGAVADTVLRRPVTEPARPLLWLVGPQLAAMALLAGSAAVGVGRYLAGLAGYDLRALVVNLAWVLVDLVVVSVVVTADVRCGRRASATVR